MDVVAEIIGGDIMGWGENECRKEKHRTQATEGGRRLWLKLLAVTSWAAGENERRKEKHRSQATELLQTCKRPILTPHS